MRATERPPEAELRHWAIPEVWSKIAACGQVLVIDVEARSDDLARRLSRRTSGSLPLLLRQVVSVSCFRLDFASDRNWCLETFHSDELSEPQILADVDRIVGTVAGAGGALVTFNGQEHDLPLLRSRQLRWLQCSNQGLLPYLDGTLYHVDVMRALSRGGSRYLRLIDACASLGLSLVGPTRLEADRRIPVEQEKGELDVVGTALLYLFLLADRLADRDLLAKGLESLGSYLRKQAVVRPHLRGLAASPIFKTRDRAAVRTSGLQAVAS